MEAMRAVTGHFLADSDRIDAWLKFIANQVYQCIFTNALGGQGENNNDTNDLEMKLEACSYPIRPRWHSVNQLLVIALHRGISANTPQPRYSRV